MNKTIALLLLSAITWGSCKKSPVNMQQPKALFSISIPFLGTNFTLNPVVMGTHDAIDLSNQSTDADSVLWDFGDQHYSNAFNASYAYSRPGSYTITLTVFNHTGKKSSYSRAVQVDERAVKAMGKYASMSLFLS